MENHENIETKEWQEYNFNNYVLVKLTDHGRDIYNKSLLSIGLNPDNYPIEVTDDGFTKIILWELMDIFGSEMYHGNPNSPFETMNFKIKPNKSETKNEISKDVIDVLQDDKQLKN